MWEGPLLKFSISLVYLMIGVQVKRMQEMPDKFHLLLQEPECTNVCFWYIPERYKHSLR